MPGLSASLNIGRLDMKQDLKLRVIFIAVEFIEIRLKFCHYAKYFKIQRLEITLQKNRKRKEMQEKINLEYFVQLIIRISMFRV